MTLIKLKEYIKRKLGYPVVNIEIDDLQLNDAISDAIEMFQEFHTDGVDMGYIFLDLIVDQTEYILDDTVAEVLKILSSNFNFTDDDQGMLLKPFYVGNSGSYDGNLIDIEIFRQNFQNMKNALEKEISYDYNPTSKRLTLFEKPTATDRISLHIFKSHEDISEIYNNNWYKQYVTALSGIQWSVNLSKYEGGKLPGGVLFNAAQIESRYQQMKIDLEEELHDRYEEPPDPIYG